MRTVLLILVGLTISGLPAEEAMRPWTSSDGRSIEGQFVGGDATSVKLKLKDGREVDIPLNRLSQDDAGVARGLVERMAGEALRVQGVETGPYAEHLTGGWEKLASADGLQFHFYSGKLKGTEQYPLCIYLHGSSNTGSGLEKREPGANGFVDEAIQRANPSIVIAPEAPAGTKSFREISARLFALINHLVANLPVDRDRIYLTGYSMGGMGTWALIAERPDFFAAAAPVGGPLGPTKVESIPAMPIWLHFGELDRAEEFRALAAQLQAGNPDFKSTEYPGADHTGFHFKVAKDPAFYEWLFAQRRKG